MVFLCMSCNNIVLAKIACPVEAEPLLLRLNRQSLLFFYRCQPMLHSVCFTRL